MTVNGSSLRLRGLQEGDAGDLARYANNRKIWKQVRDQFPIPYTLDDARNYIRFAASRADMHIFGMEVNGAVVGVISIEVKADIYRKNGELGFWLGEPFWNKGITTEAIGMITELGFKNLRLNRLYAEVFENNPASAHALEKNGFNLEARLAQAAYKDGRFLDVHIWTHLNPNRR